jgi:hypothetical protein
MDAIGTMDKSDALVSLHPLSKWIVRGEDIEWFSEDITEPTASAINKEVIRLQAAYDVLAWARNRKTDYDALNQLELLTDDAANSTTTHADAIAAVKTKWPKNNTGPVE